MRFGSERDDRLGSRPAVGAEPDALYTRYLRPVPAQRRGEVAAVRRLAVIAADDTPDDDLFPPSPALRIKWRRLLAWSPVLALAGLGAVTAARYILHHPLAYWAVAFTAVYFAVRATPDGRP